MTKNKQKNENSDILEVSGVLFDKIMGDIRREKKIKETRRRVVLFSFGLSLSLAAIVPAYNMVSGQIAQTGFGYFLSLIFSDYALMANYWGTFSMALLESFPVAEAIMFITSVFFVLGFLSFLARDARSLFNQLDNKAGSFN